MYYKNGGQTMQRNDLYRKLPEDFAEYVGTYGPHFSERLYKWAVGQMQVKDETSGKKKKLEAWSPDEVDAMLKRNGIELKNGGGYDVYYLANMLKADFYKKSLQDEAHLCLHIKLYVDDIDGNPTRTFDEFYANCIGRGIVIPWRQML